MTNRPMGSRPVSTGNPDLIREDIERTRGNLGQTMEDLAAKADVKARAREAADRAKAQARERVMGKAQSMQHQSEELAHKATEGMQRAGRRPAPMAAAATAAGAAAAAAGTIIFLRRRRAARARARRGISRLWQARMFSHG
jgi:Tfp pilus assembly protein FimV